MKYKIVIDGRCECLLEPRGEHGLEGYVKGRMYRYQYMEKAGAPPPRRQGWFRVYPGDDGADGTYYETCGRAAFRRFFRDVKGSA